MRKLLVSLILLVALPLGAARDFDGTGDWAVSPAAFNDDAKLSVSFWLFIPSGSSNVEFDRVFELGAFNTGDGGLSIEIGGGTQPNIDAVESPVRVRLLPAIKSISGLVLPIRGL